MSTAPGRYFSALVQHETELWNILETRLFSSGMISVGRLKALQVVDETDICRIQDLADRLGITVGAASRLTDRLVADDLVARTPHPTDRRGSRIELCEAGRSALRTARPVMDGILAELLAEVDPLTLSEVTAMMEMIDQSIRTANERTSA